MWSSLGHMGVSNHHAKLGHFGADNVPGPDEGEDWRRYFQALCFANDTRIGNPDSNFYAYPLPIIPIMDAKTKEIIRIDHLATGGEEDGLKYGTRDKNFMNQYRAAEYVPELVKGGLRTDMKAINVVQPDGPSFKITNESLVEWQKWRFRVGFNYREGATLHDITYDERSVMYRLSMSEMVSKVQTKRYETELMRR